MKSVFSVIWKVIAVAMICVGIYLLIQVLGDAESVIDSYEQLTGNSIGATNSIKIVFLRDYIQHTGNTDILVTLGVTPAEAELILKEDIQPSNSATPEDERQQAGEEHPVSEGSNPEPPEVGEGESFEINYASISNLGLTQNQANFAKLRGSGNTTLKSHGCAIFAIYNAYLCNTSDAKHLEDILLENRKNSLTINSEGFLEGSLGAVAEGSDTWNYISRNYLNPGSLVYSNAHNDGNISVDSKIQEDGKYIIYYSHAKDAITSNHSNCHWVYAERSGGQYTVYNPSSIEKNDIGGKPLVKYYKVG